MRSCPVTTAARYGVLALLLAAASAPADASRVLTDDEKWEYIDHATRSDQPVVTYRANFDQEKLSPLLRDPIRSQGTVRMASSISRWDTHPPNASAMTMRDGELQIYYPEQQTLEVYELQSPKFRLAMSPTPDFTFLREHFTINEFDLEGDHRIRILLWPDDEEFNEAIEEVEVVVDRDKGGIQSLAVTDIDGETTTLKFRDIELNPELDPLELLIAVPEGTKVIHPLEAVDG